MGEDIKTAIAPSSRRHRYKMLVHLPTGKTRGVRDGLIATIATLPATCADRDLGQGTEMQPQAIQHAIDMAVYFCERLALATRQQREQQRTLRQYFPKGTDLSAWS